MTKNVNSNTPKQKSGLLIKIISAILILFAILCTLLLFEDSSSALVITIVGVIMLVITMNVADHLKVNKHNAKTFTIISIVLNLLSIIFAFKQLIFPGNFTPAYSQSLRYSIVLFYNLLAAGVFRSIVL